MPKFLTGKIISVRGPKTVIVKIEIRRLHPLYGKIVKRTKKYKVDSENLEVKVGDRVKIQETRPLSKEKHFRLVEVSRK